VTTIDKLLEVGLVCPCGGKATHEFFDRGTHDVDFFIRCIGCGYEFCGSDYIEVIARLLVLTGGPISGSIPPPDVKCRYLTPTGTNMFDTATQWDWDISVKAGVTPGPYMLWPAQRTLPLVTEWLETEYED